MDSRRQLARHVKPRRNGARLALLAAGALLASAIGPSAMAWEPTKPVQFIIPAGTGGGADQMARFIQGVVAKNSLMKQPMITVNKGGGAGAEGFLEVKKSSGDPHNIIITLSNLFTTPYGTGVPFSWKDRPSTRTPKLELSALQSNNLMLSPRVFFDIRSNPVI